MALTVTQVVKYVIGDRTEIIADITFDSSYPTGGESLTYSLLGFRNRVRWVTPGLVSTAGTASPTKLVVWDHINDKALLYTAAGTEAANASDQSTVKVRVRAVGK